MHLAALLSCVTLACGQPEEPKKVRYEDLPPAAQLGVRVEALQRLWPVTPSVVIVPDPASYIEAIGHWTPSLRYPVLIDDGTPAAREDIARFVRGFGAAGVFRWSTKGAEPAREGVDSTLQRVWANVIVGETSIPKVESNTELVARWKSLQVPRSGIVVAAWSDPAWTAALALAAGRAQPLAWVDRPGGLIDAVSEAAALRALETAIEKACDQTGFTWKSLGDDIDAVTLCMGIPGKVKDHSGTILAMTDLVGRSPPEGNLADGQRWAWTGQVFGTESRSAYLAMCSLFLKPARAWLVDGYPKTKPWSDFDVSAAAPYLERLGIEPSVDDLPRGSERAWRLKATTSINAGLIAVNSKGMASEFYLEPGRCVPADVPVLNVPSMVYFVHSWSALAPIDRHTVGGRWVERGVYAYLGSVDEPYLQAFVPTPIAIGRLASKFPFAAAVRPDGGKGWKLTVLGDPLATISAEFRRVENPLPLAGAIDLREEMKSALEKRDYSAAIRALALLGRDADIAALVKGLLAEDPDSLTPAAAEDAVLPLFRVNEPVLMARSYARLDEAGERPDLRDALWHAAHRALPGTRDRDLVELMMRHIRDDSIARDSLELAPACAATLGHEAAAAMLRKARTKVEDSATRQLLDESIRRHTER